MGFSLSRTGTAFRHQLLHQLMQQLRLGMIRRPVIDLFSIPAAGDQTAGPQLFQVVGDRRTAHVYHSGQIHHTFFAMTQDPKQPQAVSVPQLPQQQGYLLEFFGGWTVLYDPGCMLPMIVGQIYLSHFTISL